MEDADKSRHSRAYTFWQARDRQEALTDSTADGADAEPADVNDTRRGDAVSGGAEHGSTWHQDSSRIPLGMDSFSRQQHDEFGQQVRLAMALMDGSRTPPFSRALPTDAASIAERLRTLGRDIAGNMADQLELLVRLDDEAGWKPSGARHCVAWMNQQLQISPQLRWEYLRVGRELRSLPVCSALFRSGSMKWSMIRQISRVATPDNESLLCHAALDATVSDIQRLCSEYRWRKDIGGESVDADAAERSAENLLALRQFEARSLTYNKASNGNTRIVLSLPPEQAEAFLNSIQHALGQLDECDKGTTDVMTQEIMTQEIMAKETTSKEITAKETTAEQAQAQNAKAWEATSQAAPQSNKKNYATIAQATAGLDTAEHATIRQITMAQRRADAAVLMAETCLQVVGRDVSMADRYQVIVTVDVNDLKHNAGAPDSGALAMESTSTESSAPASSGTGTGTSAESSSGTGTESGTETNTNSTTGNAIPSVPRKRPTIVGGDPLSVETVRRLACDCMASIIVSADGEPVDIGRKSRIWPSALARAIKVRDQHCQFPGCTQTRHLQIHPIQHWAEGGSTGVDNGVCLCSRHHTFVHEGGLRIERLNGHAGREYDDFIRQRASGDALC